MSNAKKKYNETIKYKWPWASQKKGVREKDREFPLIFDFFFFVNIKAEHKAVHYPISKKCIVYTFTINQT